MYTPMKNDLWILIPAYKPEPKMLPFLQELAGLPYPVLLVDDGGGASFNPIFKQAEALGCRLVRHAGNMGKGRALKTGINEILNLSPGVRGIVTADCDGQHTVADIARVADALTENPEKLIIGSRALKENVPLRSRFGNGWMRFIFHAATGTRVHDTQTGLRGLPARILPPLLTLKGERYEYEMNMLLAMRAWNISPLEVEIQTIYENNNAGSHFSTFRDAFRVLAQILKFIVSSALSYVLDYGLYSALLLLLPLFFPNSLPYVIPVSFAVARVISATFNYTLNRRLIFKNGPKNCALRYFLLAGTVLLIGTLSLNALTHIGINKFLAKPLVDFVLFFVNYVAQRELVFVQPKKKEE